MKSCVGAWCWQLSEIDRRTSLELIKYPIMCISLDNLKLSAVVFTAWNCVDSLKLSWQLETVLTVSNCLACLQLSCLSPTVLTVCNGLIGHGLFCSSPYLFPRVQTIVNYYKNVQHLLVKNLQFVWIDLTLIRSCILLPHKLWTWWTSLGSTGLDRSPRAPYVGFTTLIALLFRFTIFMVKI